MARWIGRTKETGKLLRILFLGGTFFSTFTMATKGVLTTLQMVTLDIFLFILLVFFIYYNDKTRLMNMQNKEQTWRAQNFINPPHGMAAKIRAEQLKLQGKYIKGEITEDEYTEKVDKVTDRLIKKYKEGIYFD